MARYQTVDPCQEPRGCCRGEAGDGSLVASP